MVSNKWLAVSDEGLIISRFIILFFIFQFLFSCNRTELKKPSEHLLSKQQMEEMLQEVYLIEAKTNVLIFNIPVDSVKMLLNYEMKSLLKQYNATYTQFKDSYSYYMGNADVSKKMVADITNRLIVLEAEIKDSAVMKTSDDVVNNWYADSNIGPYKDFKIIFQWEDVSLQLKLNNKEKIKTDEKNTNG